GSNPVMASKASRRKAMLQPGMCSAASSSSKTCVGAPGETATHDATKESSGGEKFGPPTAPNSDDSNRATRKVSQSGSAMQSASVKAMISPVAALIPTLRAALNP